MITFQEAPMIKMCIMNIQGRWDLRNILESCCHRIECTVTTFLAAFMLRRPLKSVALTTTTHRKPERVSNGIGTQVKAQMINKCRIKIIQEEIYNVKNPP